MDENVFHIIVGTKGQLIKMAHMPKWIEEE